VGRGGVGEATGARICAVVSRPSSACGASTATGSPEGRRAAPSTSGGDPRPPRQRTHEEADLALDAIDREGDRPAGHRAFDEELRDVGAGRRSGSGGDAERFAERHEGNQSVAENRQAMTAALFDGDAGERLDPAHGDGGYGEQRAADPHQHHLLAATRHRQVEHDLGAAADVRGDPHLAAETSHRRLDRIEADAASRVFGSGLAGREAGQEDQPQRLCRGQRIECCARQEATRDRLPGDLRGVDAASVTGDVS
jgi:hypothetical protein